ncbi:MAG TPA: methyltransferase domain-containing protein, partial [Chthonomonadales bacterium]|nr:methyltransferase domain-containing protein [Chthonomonadales bacterium]
MPHDTRYVLATGEGGAERLRVVQSVHGPDTERLLLRVGLTQGMKVADIGCGIGTISCWMAQQVGPTGAVYGIDISPEQIALAC